MTHTGIPSRFAVLLLCTGVAFAQHDPGPRGGPAGAGGYYPTLGSDEQTAFMQAMSVFQELEAVPDGLGPTFNGNSCAMCHAQPAVGGSSPGLNSPQDSAPNPQVALATLNGATNIVPAFITAAGPVREARFISTNPSNPSAPLDGGVHGVFTIQGRADAVGCTLAQPNFGAQLAAHNVIFRIPTPVFGLGLVENTPDAALQTNLSANSALKNMLGIRGTLNTSGNDGTVTRFGWKAQNKSLMMFAGEAYNVEMGVSNELFTNERSAVAGCVFNPTPEDYTHMAGGTTTTADVVNFALFMRLLAPPAPTTASASELNGQTQFAAIGCALCHSTTLTTAQAPFTGMSNVTYHPYSDFALHHMGANLADGVNQGAAGPDQFRTAPLWGVGQRLFFLHDGRTSDLMQAIEAHSSPSRCSSTSSQNQVCGSEANTVINKFNALPTSTKQDILNFLRSL